MAYDINPPSREGQPYRPYAANLGEGADLTNRTIGIDFRGVEVSGVMKAIAPPKDVQAALQAVKARKEAEQMRKGASARASSVGKQYLRTMTEIQAEFGKYLSYDMPVPTLISDSVAAAVMGSRKWAQSFRRYMVNLDLARELFDVNQTPAATENVVRGMCAMHDVVDCVSQYGSVAELSKSSFLDQMAWAYASAIGAWRDQKSTVDNDDDDGPSNGSRTSELPDPRTWAGSLLRIRGRRCSITRPPIQPWMTGGRLVFAR